MRYKKFKEEVIDSLNKYKGKLGVKENGNYRYREKDIPEPHILPLDENLPRKKAKEEAVKRYNQLECVRDYDFLLKNKLHKYAHHLNSSQLMCYNFFRLFVEKEKHPALIKLLKNYGINIYTKAALECKFEYENEEPEWAGELTRHSKKTNFDFYVGAGDIRAYFEIKYTEQAFGSYSKSEEESHRKKYQGFYQKKIKGCPAIKSEIEFGEVFRKNYQLVRNVIRVTDLKKYAVFIYDERNDNIRNQFESFKNEYISEEYKKNVVGITWQSLLRHLCSTEKELVEQFREKYL